MGHSCVWLLFSSHGIWIIQYFQRCLHFLCYIWMKHVQCDEQYVKYLLSSVIYINKSIFVNHIIANSISLSHCDNKQKQQPGIHHMLSKVRITSPAHFEQLGFSSLLKGTSVCWWKPYCKILQGVVHKPQCIWMGGMLWAPAGCREGLVFSWHCQLAHLSVNQVNWLRTS